MGGRLARPGTRRSAAIPTDYDAVFEYGLNALLAPLRDGMTDFRG